ncbi:VIT1/CCC1 family predicted Fe2+/Mn2+ transporter [Sphingomonas faeni]|uniref:VIT1/CCC1 family predicted Fe2+/Mn2+ transporter n=1 Tax=Sphingomonas faeni TaxID=185950 RepID=A0A2T5U712_9SPHN|nr:VIT family protein [Sphingomonas faeni]PTW47302.1 VIT1/CCC1 family predicted Fe2+/Mn2+ transporter [Sphingomonas faeni]
MGALSSHRERHVADRIGWLRAAVLGANDGIVSTASLIIGVAVAGGQVGVIVIAGTAGMVAGAMSMAAGEYVSVSAQADTETAELGRERRELADDPRGELAELAAIYVARGVDAATAMIVAAQLMARDALGAHARDELDITLGIRARPVQAAFASAASFTAGAALPLLTVFIVPPALLVWAVAGGSLVFLALLGAIGAKTGGASVWRGTLRVTFWGAFAMAATAAIGRLIGGTV